MKDISISIAVVLIGTMLGAYMAPRHAQPVVVAHVLRFGG